MIQSVFVDQEISADILFWRCFDALSLTEKDLKAHSDDLNPPDTQKTKVRELVASHSSAYNKMLERPTMYKVRASMTTKDEDEALGKARSEAKKCHIATRHDSKNQLPKLEMAGRVHLADLESPGNSRHARNRPKFLQPQAVCHPGSKPVTQKLKAYEPEKASQQGSKSRTYQRFIDKIQEKAYQSYT
ncbi:hypothetical protein PIB30_067438 [Stylosanthes scabra]|uniref:Uncharacterized protein n=1 Tax=Stylosanthes scabra TaxID=79078 RepID=A0ABU6UM37_9FABA|nr:hypothetical protein [Stylosanthes scabra]